MSTRLQVVMEESELAEIRAVAGTRRMTVSAWVRETLRAERSRPLGQAGTVRESGQPYGDTPEGPAPRVRVELELKEELVDAVRLRYHLPNDRAAVEFALRRAAVHPMSKEQALAMEGAGWDGDLESMRSEDPGHHW